MYTPVGQNMLALGLKGGAVIGLTALLAMPSEPQFYVLCATLITAVSGLVAQFLRDRASERKAEREATAERERREYELRRTEDFRRQVRSDVIRTSEQATELHTALLDNTQLVKEGIQKTETLASTIPAAQLAADTNQTAHRIEERL